VSYLILIAMPMWLLAVARTYLFCGCGAVHFVMCHVCNFEHVLLAGTGTPTGNGDGRKLSPASVDGGGDGEILSPRGRGWAADPRREFPVAIPSCGLVFAHQSVVVM
jgi:hypothetical protein